MMGTHFSLILLPTLSCNAACDYCFENKTRDFLSLEKFAVLVQKIVDYMVPNDIDSVTIHWQGGEVMTLPPKWFEQAFDIVERAAATKNKQINNCIQTNMMEYDKSWNTVLAEMFGNNVGSSLDFPNLHRKMAGSSPEDYNGRWAEKIQEAKDAGISVGVISIPNEKTFGKGAERFYSYFVDDLGITDFQINTPFPGGQINAVKKSLPLDMQRFAQFLGELADVWMENGYNQGIRVGPFDQLIEYFLMGDPHLPCIWGDNCANEFVCIDPRGYVSQCDCWVSSYPQYRFGNIFECRSFSELLQNNLVRQRFLSRPGVLIEQEECIACDYLALCHGGCPVRAYAVHGSLLKKDPYCEAYKSLFGYMEAMASKIAGSRSAAANPNV